MAVLPILIFPDDRLSQPAEPVAEFGDDVQGLAADLIDTMLDGSSAVGIAAPQIGQHKRVVIVDVSAMMQSSRKHKPKSSNNGRMVLVNPEIVQREGEIAGREGCLSVPDYTGNVVRADSIVVRAFDIYGNATQFRCRGFESRAMQHEIDHLDGILFLDRVISPRELFRRKVYK
ncbi:MAG: peptide deformylase [Acidiferrobacterales bacterium]